MVPAYYDRAHLPAFPEIGRGSPELARAFFAYYGQVFVAGALSAKEKALAALAVAHEVQCPYCIDAYTSGSLEKGADLVEMTEAIHLGAMIRARSVMAYGEQAKARAKQLSLSSTANGETPYFDRQHAASEGGSDLDRAFFAWRDGLQAESQLEPRTKAAIAVACAHAIQCPYSIDLATQWASAQALDLTALTEAVHVATAIRGGASLVHGLQMMDRIQSRKDAS